MTAPEWACAAGLAMIMAAGTAVAEPVPWKTVNGWDVSFYPDFQGCQAFAVFDGGTTFFIGYDLRDGGASLDLSLLNRDWDFLTDAMPYEVTLQFDDESPWQVAMTGMEIEGFPGLWAQIDARAPQAEMLVQEFTRKHHMHWRLAERDLGRFTLRGSQKAYDTVRACQAAKAPLPPEPAGPLPVVRSHRVQ